MTALPQTIQRIVSADESFTVDPADSHGLTLAVTGGLAVVDQAWSVIAATTVDLDDDTTNYVERTLAGVVSSNTTAFTATSIPICIAVTAGSVITVVTLYRPLFDARLPHAGADNEVLVAASGLWTSAAVPA